MTDRQQRDLNDAIVAVAALPQLGSLMLIAHGARSCCLTPLITAPKLHTLDLCLGRRVFDSSTAIDALRNMPHLRSLSFTPSAGSFTRMLQPPHTMKLDKLDMDARFTAEFGESIVHLAPSLTDVNIRLCSSHADFLRQLPNLRRLVLSCHLSTMVPDTDRIMHSLHAHVELTELSLLGSGEFPLRITSTHLAACLPLMPLLTHLELLFPTALDSLRFLSSGPITHSLTVLRLCQFSSPLPLSELHHVHELSSLTDLWLFSVFDRPLDTLAEALYKPPSPLLPSLRTFRHDNHSK
jgi:hypothetical protein